MYMSEALHLHVHAFRCFFCCGEFNIPLGSVHPVTAIRLELILSLMLIASVLYLKHLDICAMKTFISTHIKIRILSFNFSKTSFSIASGCPKFCLTVTIHFSGLYYDQSFISCCLNRQLFF